MRYKIYILKTTWGTVSCAESMFANDTIYLHQDRAVKLLRALSNLAKWATQWKCCSMSLQGQAVHSKIR